MLPTHEKVAFLGIGTMGHGMAGSAVRSGVTTVVWDRKPDHVRDIAARGAEVANTAADAAARAGIVVTMVPDADAVISVAVDNGMLDALPENSIWAQMSTIGVRGTDRVAALVADRRPDVTLVDAPVSGSKVPAERGELTIFASGPDHARSRVAPLFDALGKRTVWIGPVGAGSRMKLANNTLLAFTAEGLASSVALAHRLGLDAATVMDAFDGSPLLSPWEVAKLQRMVTDEYSAEFALGLALKDVRLALDMVDSTVFETLDALSHEWERAVAQGMGSEDVMAVTRMLEGSTVTR